jgi:hypothetical protein
MFPDDGGIAHFEPVADVHPPGMAPDLGGEKQNPQACRRRGGVLERCHLGVFLGDSNSISQQFRL